MNAVKPSKRENHVDGRRARRTRTEAKLLTALGELLREEGVAAVGVNAIAARAEVDKVLVYRYFGGLEGLLASYAESAEFWPTLDEILGPSRALLVEKDHARAAARMLANYATALRRRPITLDLLAWECAHRTSLTEAVEKVREERSRELYQLLGAAGFPLEGGLFELSALFAASINYLAVRGRQIALFGGLRIATTADWQRIERVFETAFGVLIGQRTRRTRRARSANLGGLALRRKKKL